MTKRKQDFITKKIIDINNTLVNADLDVNTLTSIIDNLSDIAIMCLDMKHLYQIRDILTIKENKR